MSDYERDNPVLYLPKKPGRLTTMRNVRNVPTPEYVPAGFTVHELGMRLHEGYPYTDWLRDNGLELLPLPDEGEGWFELRRLES